ncbi:hypothetical protein T4B_3965 [Trichinella pseudospiralis]|uniref:Uncharacterized protein n=2 Tax=Trichinella pseudospiralis TaxID=6337 RepID=A0A0V1FJ46_TRIPS|nr:hypothetical protein T4A_8874 [Trichinella pseudospiralis]KRY86077.1 hypothetical protein T4D_16297 [Trichinella pseudospiralis]KRZ30358.1 hypothetical protein T4B_3965 [Trichinella pseudospiralis]
MVHWDSFTDRTFARFTHKAGIFIQGLHFAYFTATNFCSTNIIKYYKQSLERYRIFLQLSLRTPQRSFLLNKIQLVKSNLQVKEIYPFVKNGVTNK